VPAPALLVDSVLVTFGRRSALDHVTLQASRSRVTAVLGPNGAGKTTLIRCCTGLITPDAGAITVLGHAAGSPAANELIGLMPQSTGAWSGIRAVELLAYLARLYASPLDVDALVARLGITDYARTPYRRLSGGQQQAVNLAGALIGRPELVFLDEPTAGMDPHLRRHTWTIIRELREAGLAVVLTTHDMHEAADLADDVWILDRGRIVIHGTLAELTRDASLEDVFLSHTTGGAA